MMISPITIEELELGGFRAYLQPQAFSLHRGTVPLNLAIFAPNAKGKSSLIDAFEFYFSEHATLERLGIRTAERNAGRTALEHVDAKARGVKPTVRLLFRQGADRFGDIREVTQQGTPLPASAGRVLRQCTLPFVIRGYKLRGFVEDETAEERYEEFVAWFGLQPLFTIQKNLRTLRRQVKQQAESTTEREERIRDLARITSNAVNQWDEPAVCAWLNEHILAKLEANLIVEAISDTDAGYRELKTRKAAEDDSIGLTSLRRFLTQIEALYQGPAEEGGDSSGAIVDFEKATAAHNAAASKEAAERIKASDAVFNDMWINAKRVLENPEIDLSACPVCDTHFAKTPHGTRESIRVELDAKLGALADYRNAQAALTSAAEVLSADSRALPGCLEALSSDLKGTGYGVRINAVETYQATLAVWTTGDASPDSAAAVAELQTLHAEISAEKQRIEDQRGEHTFADALKTADDLNKLKGDLGRIGRIKDELAKLNVQLNQQSLIINKAIVEYTHQLIAKLKEDVNSLYKEIQGEGADAPPIRIELPDEEDINQQRIQLLIDFADNRMGVVPSGYLSDSQIHALALSLRLAAIRTFNSHIPIIILDDIVTSYDADHRKNIAAMLAKHFADYQIVIVTHDERFFILLQDHLPSGKWIFKRITELRPEFGPIFHDHRTPDEIIQARLDSGEGAANEIRQGEEEWLLDICRAFRGRIQGSSATRLRFSIGGGPPGALRRGSGSRASCGVGR